MSNAFLIIMSMSFSHPQTIKPTILECLLGGLEPIFAIFVGPWPEGQSTRPHLDQLNTTGHSTRPQVGLMAALWVPEQLSVLLQTQHSKVSSSTPLAPDTYCTLIGESRNVQNSCFHSLGVGKWHRHYNQKCIRHIMLIYSNKKIRRKSTHSKWK